MHKRCRVSERESKSCEPCEGQAASGAGATSHMCHIHHFVSGGPGAREQEMCECSLEE